MAVAWLQNLMVQLTGLTAYEQAQVGGEGARAWGAAPGVVRAQLCFRWLSCVSLWMEGGLCLTVEG